VRELGLIAAGVLVLLLATASSYGFHRDELYFMEAGHHPAWSYDDQPPLTPLIARAATAVFGATPTGLRVLSALAFVACLVLTALIARELGGGRRAQVVAALALSASSLIYVGHLVSTTTYDFLAWTLLLYLLVRIVRRQDPRLWVIFGAILGLALENKWLPATLVAGLLLGAALCGNLRLLCSRWAIAGAALALALWLPNLIWQADHAWPQRELASQIAHDDPLGLRLKFLPFQFLIVSPFLAYVWLRGLHWLLRDRAARSFRMLGVGYLAVIAICLVTGAKEYYAIGFYPMLLAAGAVASETRLGRRSSSRRFAAAVVASAALAWTIQLPLVPVQSLHDSPFATVNQDALETIGWPRLVATVTRVWRTLPEPARRRAVIFTENYGEAGALAQYGQDLGLPRAYSGHNSYATFGVPTGASAPLIAVGVKDPRYLRRFFVGCRVVARVDNGVGIENEEQGAPIDLCVGPRQPWATLWPRLHHLDA
jgi:hypothetical protein